MTPSQTLHRCDGALLPLRVVKAATSLDEATVADSDAVVGAGSRTFLCHVRFATHGAVCDSNTHPFVAEHGGVQLPSPTTASLAGCL